MLVGANHPEVIKDVIEDVIDGCRRGEPGAFRELFQSHKDMVYSVALRYSGDPAVAMDIAQDTFVKLMGRIQQFRGESSFDSWLYRLVVNSCLDHRRRRSRLQPLVDQVLEAFRAPERSALDELMRDEFHGQVQDAVSKLAPDQRMAVVLRYTEGLSYEEIAEALGCSRGTVASRLNRAHKILERRLRHLQKGHQTKE
jgi:RNA polymerase sigma-70 factor (ECF subfamily)